LLGVREWKVLNNLNFNIMENTDKKSSLFSNETLDSMAMAEIQGGAAGTTKTNCGFAKCSTSCGNYTYCAAANCVEGCGTKCDCTATMEPPTNPNQYPIGIPIV
jgi:hypothetical protein